MHKPLTQRRAERLGHKVCMDQTGVVKLKQKAEVVRVRDIRPEEEENDL
jgi:hypothetical protein